MIPTAASPIAILAIALAGALSLDVLAAEPGHEGEHEEHRQHGTHVHGTGALNVVLEEGEVHIELDSPAANILGFEHTPSSKADQETLEQAVATLTDGDRLFRFPEDAQCRLTKADVESSLLDHAEEEHHDEEEDHNNDEHGQEEAGHADEAEQDHQHQHKQSGEGEVHSDIAASWQFTCAHPEKLDNLEVGLFQAFPRTERLQLQFITAGGQGAAELTAADPVLRF